MRRGPDTHHASSLGILFPAPALGGLPLRCRSVWSRFLVGRGRPSPIQKTKRADSLLLRITCRSALSSCCLRSSPLAGRRRYHVALAGRGPPDSWKATGGWDSVFRPLPCGASTTDFSASTSGFPPQWSLVVDDEGSSPCQGPFSLSWPCLRGAFAPPSPSHLRSSKQQHAEAEAEAACICQRGRRESGRLRRASLPATLLYGRSHVSVSPGVQGELSYPTHASRGGRATRRCERAVQWEEEEEEPAWTHCSLLAASLRPREGRAAAGRSLLFFDGQDLTTTASKTMPAGAADACGAVTSKGEIPRDIVADRLSLTRSELLRPPLSRRRRLEDSVPLLLGGACMPSALPAVGLLTTATRKIQTSPAISRRMRPATAQLPYRDRHPNPTMVHKLVGAAVLCKFSTATCTAWEGGRSKRGGGGSRNVVPPSFSSTHTTYMSKDGERESRDMQRAAAEAATSPPCTMYVRDLCVLLGPAGWTGLAGITRAQRKRQQHLLTPNKLQSS